MSVLEYSVSVCVCVHMYMAEISCINRWLSGY